MGIFDKITGADTQGSVQTPIYDENGTLMAYKAGDQVLDTAGNILGSTEVLNTAMIATNVVNREVAKADLVSTRTEAPKTDLVQVAKVTASSMKDNSTDARTKGVIGLGTIEEDTLLPLTIETSRLQASLTNTVWPVVPVRPAFAGSFDDAGLTLSPRVGRDGLQILSNLLTCPVLGYKITAAITNTLNGNSRVKVYGADPANYISYLLKDTISTIYALPRTNGVVRNYTPTGGVDGTFGTSTTADFTATVVDTSNDLVNDDYAPEGAFFVGGTNCDVRVIPFVPTPAQVLELQDVIAQQDQAAVVNWIFGKLMKL